MINQYENYSNNLLLLGDKGISTKLSTVITIGHRTLWDA